MTLLEQEIHLLEPMARSYESRSVGNKAPCGNTEKGTTHFLTQAGSRNYFQWRTLKSHETANCTVKISTGFDDFDTDFKVLRPRDDSADAEGRFACGRKAGYEGKEFRLPNDLICDSCVLQFTQEISDKEHIHQCADIVVKENLSASGFGCPLPCLNGGTCMNGACVCRDGFFGEQC